LCDGSGLHVGREAILIRLPEQSLNSPRLLHHNIFTERLFDMVGELHQVTLSRRSIGSKGVIDASSVNWF